MTRKSGGPPDGRTDEEPWQPPGSEELLQRTIDLALEVEVENEADDEPEFIYGDIVHDTEAEDPIALVVVNIPHIDADEWEFEDGETLADKNEKCPEDDYVIVVVPLAVLQDYLPDWDEREEEVPIDQLLKDEIPFAPFPSLRLIRVEDSHLR